MYIYFFHLSFIFWSQAKVECHTSITEPMLPDLKSGTKYLQSHQRPGDEHSYLTQTTEEG